MKKVTTDTKTHKRHKVISCWAKFFVSVVVLCELGDLKFGKPYSRE